MCVHACVYLGHCAQDGGGLWGGFRMLTVGVLRGPELYTEDRAGMAASRALPRCVSCCGWGGHVKETARSGCDRPEPPSLRGPFPPSAGQQFRPRACLIGTCVRNQSLAVPGGPGRHRPFQRDSLGTPGARRWAAALPTAPPHTCLALPKVTPEGRPMHRPSSCLQCGGGPCAWTVGKHAAGGEGFPWACVPPTPLQARSCAWLGSGVPAPPCTCAPHTMPPQPESMQATPGVALPRQG